MKNRKFLKTRLKRLWSLRDFENARKQITSHASQLSFSDHSVGLHDVKDSLTRTFAIIPSAIKKIPKIKKDPKD